MIKGDYRNEEYRKFPRSLHASKAILYEVTIRLHKYWTGKQTEFAKGMAVNLEIYQKELREHINEIQKENK